MVIESVTTKSGLQFPRGANDWKFMFSNVKKSASSSVSNASLSTGIVSHALSSLNRQGFLVVVFSNQGAIRNNVTGKKAMSVRTMMDDVFTTCMQSGSSVKALDRYILMMAAQKDHFRKPETGMFQYLNALLEKLISSEIEQTTTCAPSNDTVERDRAGMHSDMCIDLESSFFVGDAAGRPGDHSDSDSVFARNVGFSHFFTPEEFFLHDKGNHLQL